MKAADGLSHHGDPAEEEEVIVVEEPDRPEKVEHRVVRAVSYTHLTLPTILRV